MSSASETSESNTGQNGPKNDEYVPNLSLKKANELQKVEILEETVQKGSLEDLKAVLKTYKKFEMTARALGLASRYRGIEFVRELVKNGATFKYESSDALQRKYKMFQRKAGGGRYSTEYYLMLVPTKIDLELIQRELEYTPLIGISQMSIPDGFEKKSLPLEERIEVTRFLSENKRVGLFLEEMLFWALLQNELEFADELIKMGVVLQNDIPSYYTSLNDNGSKKSNPSRSQTYLETITSGSRSVYWDAYVTSLARLKEPQVLPVLTRFNSLAVSAGKQLHLNQKLYNELKWNEETLLYALVNMDCSEVNQKKAIEAAISANRVDFLKVMAQAGWLSQSEKTDSLITYAQDNKFTEALAWLIDFKNRTTDVSAEEARKEKKAVRELMEDPLSISALKRIWSYKKLKNGTLELTSYKGNDTRIVIPSEIGKDSVTVIGKGAFSPSSSGVRANNRELRSQITEITVPEGITAIEDEAFFECESLRTVNLPRSLKKIGSDAFRRCRNLRAIEIPSGIRTIGKRAFGECNSLRDKNGFTIVSKIVLDYRPQASDKDISLPDDIVKINDGAFSECKKLTCITIPNGVKSIGAEAFADTSLETVYIPQSVKTIGNRAFYACNQLKDFFISSATEKLGTDILGTTWYRASEVNVHTPSGSYAEEYMKQYGRVHIVNDYTE